LLTISREGDLDECGTPMSWKMLFCLRRLPGVDADEFSRYWRDEHALLFRQYADALAVRRYTQSHRLPGGLNAALRTHRNAPDGYDGVAEVWFDSLDELRAAMTSDAGRAAAEILIEDERRFIDHSASPIWIAEEIEIGVH
jgi:uncharacterized protein (TIGR02118 family)